QLALDRSGHGLGNLARDLDHLRLALTPALDAIGCKADNREVAEVLDLESGLTQRAEQPGLAQRGRRLLLPGPVGAGARWDADQAELHGPCPTVPRRAPERASHLGPSGEVPPASGRPTSPTVRRSSPGRPGRALRGRRTAPVPRLTDLLRGPSAASRGRFASARREARRRN